MPGFPHTFPFIFGLITGSENPNEFPLRFPFAFGLVKGDGDLAVAAAIDADMSVVHYLDGDVQVQADLWAGVTAALVGYTDTPVTVDLSAHIGDGIASDTTVTAVTDASSSAQLLIEADLVITAESTVAGGYAVRGTPTIEAVATADTRLDAFSGSSLAGTVDLTGHVGDGITTQTGVDASAVAGLNVHRDIAVNLNATFTADAVVSRGSNLSGDLTVTAHTSASESVNRQFEANLAATVGESAATRKTIHAGANTVTVSASVSASMSLGQAVQANLSSQIDASGEERRNQYSSANFPILVTIYHGDTLLQYAGTTAYLDVAVGLSASATVSTFIAADLPVAVVATARFELGGTTADRIMLVEVDVRIMSVEARESLNEIPVDIRSMPIEPRQTVFPMDVLDRRMLVEQL